jgi:hypothetical protein
MILVYNDHKEKHQSFEAKLVLADPEAYNGLLELPGDVIGYGRDEAEAVADLREKLTAHALKLTAVAMALRTLPTDTEVRLVGYDAFSTPHLQL